MSMKRAKRGDTFALTVTRLDAAGNPVSLAGVTVACKMRSGSASITLTTAITNAAGGVVALSAAPAATVNWAPGVYSCDVQYSTGGDVQSSDTFEIEVVEDVTY